MNLSLTLKLLILGAVFTVLPALIIFLSVYFQNNKVLDSVLTETERLANSDLKHITEGVYSLCESQQEVLESYVGKSLDVAHKLVEMSGGVKINTDSLSTWEGTNQITKEKQSVVLPLMKIGDKIIEPNKDPKIPSPIVDEVKNLQNVTCTIFQRMNDAGDMLRVCTNVLTKEGYRAIGTYIPAKEPDGNPNAVVNTVLKGERYKGLAFVVDRWYITAYDPICDSGGKVIGMLYAGIPQESTTALRKAIMDIVIGKTGYVFVLNGKGINKGYCVISYKGTRDGKNEWETKDANGEYFIQNIINKALTLKGKETAIHYYTWKKADDITPRKKIAMIMYYEPWDWVIGCSAYVDELQEVESKIRGTFQNQIILVITLSVLTLVVSLLFWFFMARRLTSHMMDLSNLLNESANQVDSASEHLASSSQDMASQVSNQVSSLEETSASLEEISSHVQESASNSEEAKNKILEIQNATEQSSIAVTELNQAMSAIKKSSDETAKIIKTIEEVAFQTNLLALNAAVEAARAGEAGRGFAVVAEEVRNLAQRSALAAKETAELLKQSQVNVAKGAEVSEKVFSAIQTITESVQKTVTLITEISTTTIEQAQGIEQINLALSSINQVSQNISATSEETASTAEELSAQAVQLKNAVNALYTIIRGEKG
ncbi:MAG: methyl-accepting chemotaxis protein [Candidatus Hydrogenedens sp.]